MYYETLLEGIVAPLNINIINITTITEINCTIIISTITFRLGFNTSNAVDASIFGM